ncbi:MAG: hypothetical protein VW397_01545 [Candidatus Margulisiibacteriota bacterium]|jgi:hypothetical protein
MAELTKPQQVKLIDLVEAFVDRVAFRDDLLDDPNVVHQFLLLSKDQSALVFAFVELLNDQQKSRLTLQDVLTEEVMLELHLIHGFKQLDLVQWLRGIDFGGFRYFETIAKDKDVLHLDQIIERSLLSMVVIQGVRIDSVLAHFESLGRLVDYAIHQRISFKQFRQLLILLSPNDETVQPVIHHLIEHHHVLKKITRSSQVLPFRIFCSFFDFLVDNSKYLTGIAQVFDELLVTSTPSKTFQLLNQMPYSIILFILKRIVLQNSPKVIAHLNEALPKFQYGLIRKIVRRHSLGLNYKYD